jgi:hypothetical protein
MHLLRFEHQVVEWQVEQVFHRGQRPRMVGHGGRLNGLNEMNALFILQSRLHIKISQKISLKYSNKNPSKPDVGLHRDNDSLTAKSLFI